MRKVVAYELLSLDGVAEQPDEFITDFDDLILEEWAPTVVVEDSLGDFVTELKQQPGGDIGIHGSISLTQSLLEASLVDELRLVIAPAVHLHGRKLFDRGSACRVSLTRSISSPTGCLLVDYQLVAEQRMPADG